MSDQVLMLPYCEDIRLYSIVLTLSNQFSNFCVVAVSSKVRRCLFGFHYVERAVHQIQFCFSWQQLKEVSNCFH